jgi:probable rRNA maturation factor
LSSSTHKIEIADQQSRQFEDENLISAVKQIFTDHGIVRSELSIAIVADPAIRQLNKQYLNHDYETDVISFVLDYDEESSFLAGQLIVSADTAANMAAQVGGSVQDELLLYVIHGTLHLVGLDDKNPSGAAEMRLAERKYLAEFGVEHRWFDEEAGSDDREVIS